MKARYVSLVDLLSVRKSILFSQLKEWTGIEEEILLRIVDALEKKGYIKKRYLPLSLEDFEIVITKEETEKIKRYEGKTLEEYPLSRELKLKVKIINEKNKLYYVIEGWEWREMIKALMDEFAFFFVRRLPTDFFLNEEIYEKEREEIEKEIKKVKLSRDDEVLNRRAVEYIKNRIFGLGEMELFFLDPNIEEIIINGVGNVAVYHKRYGWLISNLEIRNEDEIFNLAFTIAKRIGRNINLLTPMLDAYYRRDARVNVVLNPISARGTSITIRRFPVDPWTITKMLDNNTLNTEVASLLWQAVQFEANIMIVGGTGSGKTSLLNALLMFIPSDERIVTIEDTKEINLPPTYWNWVSLITRPPNTEGKGEITMLQLMINSLRMRPDRIVVGEIRRKNEAMVLLEAMHTGHSVFTTFHADTIYDATQRLTRPPINLPQEEIEGIDIFITQYRNRRTNIRRTYEVGEVMVRKELDIVRGYLWDAKRDLLRKMEPLNKYMEMVNSYTGMTEKEILEDLKEKELVLKYMLKRKIFHYLAFGQIIDRYYREKEKLMKEVKKVVRT